MLGQPSLGLALPGRDAERVHDVLRALGRNQRDVLAPARLPLLEEGVHVVELRAGGFDGVCVDLAGDDLGRGRLLLAGGLLAALEGAIRVEVHPLRVVVDPLEAGEDRGQQLQLAAGEHSLADGPEVVLGRGEELFHAQEVLHTVPGRLAPVLPLQRQPGLRGRVLNDDHETLLPPGRHCVVGLLVAHKVGECGSALLAQLVLRNVWNVREELLEGGVGMERQSGTAFLLGRAQQQSRAGQVRAERAHIGPLDQFDHRTEAGPRLHPTRARIVVQILVACQLAVEDEAVDGARQPAQLLDLPLDAGDIHALQQGQIGLHVCRCGGIGHLVAAVDLASGINTHVGPIHLHRAGHHRMLEQQHARRLEGALEVGLGAVQCLLVAVALEADARIGGERGDGIFNARPLQRVASTGHGAWGKE
mmetsp:Transcript_82312/g.183825  ORF Transcript_82312/g.183825 Transcript_82312/m.183825 type:complete len:419 (+) Transcript_82312:265-1521(+)